MFSAFSFARKGTKEKAWQKENAEKEISPSAEGDKGSAPLTAPPFEKGGRKLSCGFALKPFDKSKFEEIIENVDYVCYNI